MLDRRVQERGDAGEVRDAVEAGGNLAAAHAEDGAAEEDVLTAGQLRMEPGADLDHGGDLPGEGDRALGGCGDPPEQLEQRALSGAVPPDDADGFAAADLEGDVAKSPELLVGGTAAEEAGETRRAAAARTPDVIALGHLLAPDVDRAHGGHVRSHPPWSLPCA
jgi:hypothetical protein